MSHDDLAQLLDKEAAILAAPDLSHALPSIRDTIIADTQRSFEQSVTPEGEPFLPLKDPRVSRRPLIRTGDLMESAIRMAGGAQLDGNKIVVDADELMSYGPIQAETRPFAPLAGISEQAAEQVADWIADEVNTQLDEVR